MQEQNIAQMLENPFMQYNHIEIVSVTSDSAVMSLDIRRDTTNIYGYVHGGAFFTMADCCAGLTAVCHPECFGQFHPQRQSRSSDSPRPNGQPPPTHLCGGCGDHR